MYIYVEIHVIVITANYCTMEAHNARHEQSHSPSETTGCILGFLVRIDQIAKDMQITYARVPECQCVTCVRKDKHTFERINLHQSVSGASQYILYSLLFGVELLET